MGKSAILICASILDHLEIHAKPLPIPHRSLPQV
jgi:hypothetical protein